MVGKYWAFICRRAFKEACESVGIKTRGPLVTVTLGVIVVILALGFWGSPDAQGDETIGRVAWIAVIVVAIFFLFAWRVVTVPAKVHGEQEGRIDTLQIRLTPRLSLSLPPDAARILRDGITQVAISGNRVGVIKREPIVLRLTCTNESDVRIDGCQAFLVDVRQVETDGRLVDAGFRESVALTWARDLERQEFETSIQPHISKAIYLLEFTESKDLVLHRSLEIPFEYHQLFKKDARYRLWIQVNGKDDVAAEIALEVVRDRGGKTLNTTVVVAERVDPLKLGVVQA
jgi:hypothetical protein